MSDEMISDGEWLQQAQPGWTAVEFPHEIVQDNFVSGDTNGRRLTVRYFRSDAEACLVAKVLFGPEAQGPPGHAHGGSMAALLDELMGGAAWMSGHMVVSAELTIRFKTMLPLGTRCIMRAQVTAADGRKVRTNSTIYDEEGTVFSEGEALFIELDPKRFGDLAADVSSLLPFQVREPS
jgi:acyl-coenzyme A thioesterase PaaI-like protein